MRTLCFYEDVILTEESNTARTFSELKEKLPKFILKSDSDYTFHTTMTDALNFEYFNSFDLIIINNKNGAIFKLYKPEHSTIVNNNIPHQKEIRLEHNLRRLWISIYRNLNKVQT